MNASRSQILVIVSAVCFAVAVLVALGVVTSDYDAWLAGGGLALALGLA